MYVIAFDGMNGSGKTTVIKNINERLNVEYSDYNIQRLVLPGSGIEGVRKIIRDPNNSFDGLTYMFLVAAEFNELYKSKIKCNSENKHIILLDRFVDSIRVYQRYVNGVSNEIIENMINLIFGDYIPTHTFIFDIPMEVSLARRNQDKEDRFEKTFHSNFNLLRYGYREQVKLPNHELVDATRSEKEVTDRCYNTIVDIIKG